MARRASKEGALYRRAEDGMWCAALVALDPATGKMKRRYFYSKTQAGVREKLKEGKKRAEVGAPVADATVKVGPFVELWIGRSLAASSRKASTKQTYSILARRHLMAGKVAPNPPHAERLAAIALNRLKPSDVEALVVGMRSEGLSGSTARQVYTVLRAVLDAAVTDGLLARNPAALVARPGVQRVEARSMPPTELGTLLSAGDATRYGPLFRLLAWTGLRRGEALALRWSDVDLLKGALTVRGTLSRVNGVLVVTEPKTEKSRRVVPMSSDLVAMLEAHREDLATERQELPEEAWKNLDLVFPAAGGGYADPRNVLRSLTVAARAAGLSGVGLHSLRHSAASVMLAGGVPLVTVSHVLGHSSVAITGDIYGHVTTDGERDAVERLAAALR